LNRYKKGQEGEDIACEYLKGQSYLIIERNYRGKRGEIDIIARDGKVIVFIEVKSWKTIPVSEAEFSIGIMKKRRMIKSAEQYLFENSKKMSGLDIRFDFIFVDAAKNSVAHNKNIIMES
jgi:putative endonuclease